MSVETVAATAAVDPSVRLDRYFSACAYRRNGFTESWSVPREDLPLGFNFVDLVKHTDRSALPAGVPPFSVRFQFNATTVLYGPGWEFASLHPDETVPAVELAWERLCEFLPEIDAFAWAAKVTRVDPSLTLLYPDRESSAAACVRFSRWARHARRGSRTRAEYESSGLGSFVSMGKGESWSVYDLAGKYENPGMAKKLHAPAREVPACVRLEARLRFPGLSATRYPPSPDEFTRSWRPRMALTLHDLENLARPLEGIGEVLDRLVGAGVDAQARLLLAGGASLSNALRLAAFSAILDGGGQAAFLALPGADRRTLTRYERELRGYAEAAAALHSDDVGPLVSEIAETAQRLYARDLWTPADAARSA